MKHFSSSLLVKSIPGLSQIFNRMTSSEIADYLLKNPKPINLKILDKIFQWVIPFNSPHSFQLESIQENRVIASLPYKKLNFNHLKGIHACAMATLGEYCAGILLIRNFNFGKYRIILSKLEIEYFYQGKSSLRCEAFLPWDEKEKIRNALAEEGQSFVQCSSQVKDEKQNLVATVKSTWQLKDWKRVRTKI